MWDVNIKRVSVLDVKQRLVQTRLVWRKEVLRKEGFRAVCWPLGVKCGGCCFDPHVMIQYM